VAIVKALFESDGHVYRHPETKQVVTSVTQILSGCGLVSYGGIRQSVLDHKAILGTEAHSACSFIAQGLEVDCDERVQPYVDGYRKFSETKQWKPLIVQPDPQIGQLNGSLVGFQPDEVGQLAGVETLLELKCTSDIYPSYGIQLAFYDMLLGDSPRQRRVLQLFPDGKFKLHVYDDRKDYEMVQCLLALHNWKILHGVTNGNGNH
jgi:hypothetical protein